MNASEKVQAYIQSKALFDASARILAAVSGGADSLCMLDCLHRLGYNLTIAHFDHQVRSNSAQEVAYLRGLADGYALPLVTGKLGAALQGGRTPSEDDLRNARYDFLARAALERGCDFIATGHTADDQIETVLMHFLRGAGSAGLSGMLPSILVSPLVGFETGDLRLVRPLLTVSSEEAQIHCCESGLVPLVDETNDDLQFLRNRIRHQLLPELGRYNPQIGEVIQRTAELARYDAEFLEAFAQEAAKLVVEDAAGAAIFSLDQLRTYPRSIQLRIVRDTIQRLGSEKLELSYKTTRTALDFLLEAPCGAKRVLPGSLYLERKANSARLVQAELEPVFPDYPQLLDRRERRMPIPGAFKLANQQSIEARIVDLHRVDCATLLGTLGPKRVAMDFKQGTSEIFLRAPKSGDRFRPLGMSGTKKISDLFIDEGIDQAARRNWPLVVMDAKILWVVGLRVAEETRLTDQSTAALVMEVNEN